MASPARSNASRRRRRIAVVGVVLALAAFAIGAPLYLSRIESDLERAVPEELAARGFDGISASFSGQDGTLWCAAPLSDPELAVNAAYDVRGVRAIELDRSCRVNRAPVVGTTTTLPEDSSSAAHEAPTTEADEPTPTLVPPDFGSLAEVLATDPQFSLLLVLVGEAGLDAELADPIADPVTLFAPTDAAFDSLTADALALLRSDPDLLAQLLRHHMVAGRLPTELLESGELATLAGDTLQVEADGTDVSVDGAPITASAVSANGVVHTIDEVLVPPSIDLAPPVPTAELTITLASGLLTLGGLVSGEEERSVLVAAAIGAAGADRVVDRLALDATGVDLALAESLARLVTVLPGNLVDGEIGYDGSALFVRGIVASPEAAEAVTALAEELEAAAELAPRPLASQDDAVALESELNALVAATPVRFEQGGTELLPDAAVVIDRAAALALRLDGIAIVVEGHTDGDGSPARNAQLSQARADAVRDALIVRGLDESAVTAEGLGSQRRIFVDGREDKEASRRVEFRVTVVD